MKRVQAPVLRLIYYFESLVCKAGYFILCMEHPVFCCAPGGARFLRVKVPNPPGSGKDIAEGKGAQREVGSEGSRMWGIY